MSLHERHSSPIQLVSRVFVRDQFTIRLQFVIKCWWDQKNETSRFGHVRQDWPVHIRTCVPHARPYAKQTIVVYLVPGIGYHLYVTYGPIPSDWAPFKDLICDICRKSNHLISHFKSYTQHAQTKLPNMLTGWSLLLTYFDLLSKHGFMNILL